MNTDFDADFARECVALDQTNLQGEFVKYTSDLAYWGAKVASAKQTESLAKLAKDVMQADLDVAAREALTGDKKPTEATVAAWVTRHPSMREAEQALISATHDFDRVRAVWEALRAKRDMLVGLGAQQRAEMQRDPMVKDNYEF